jgi:hypothetical protein
MADGFQLVTLFSEHPRPLEALSAKTAKMALFHCMRTASA